MSDSSDDDLSGFISPSSIRPSMRRDVGMGSARQTSTIVKAAARRQLRGDSDKKPVKEVAADIRRRMNESASPGKSSEHSPPPSSSMIMSAPVTPFQDNVSAGSAASPAAVGVPLRQVVVRRRGMGTAPANGLVGIGIKFTVDAGEHKVTSLLPEGPADMTRQVFQGDKLIAVDGVPLFGKTSDEVIDLILGPAGSDLVLTLVPSGSQQNEHTFISPSFQQTPTGPGNQTATCTALEASPREERREANSSASSRRQSSVGIKFVLYKKGHIKVQHVIPGLPAAQCMRIHPGDLLVRVDGVEVSGMGAIEIEQLVQGPYGSPVSLTLESAHDKERRSVRLTRKEMVEGSFVNDERGTETQDILKEKLQNGDAGAERACDQQPAAANASTLPQNAGPTLKPGAGSSSPVAQPPTVLSLDKRLSEMERLMQRDQERQWEQRLQTLDNELEAQKSRIAQLSQKIERVAGEKQACACLIS